MGNQKKIFVASSNNERGFAEKISGMLEEIEDVKVISWWEDGIFIPGQITLKEVLRAAQECDAGVFIFEDIIESANEKNQENIYSGVEKSDTTIKINENILIEAGMFCGMRDSSSICLLKHAESDIKIPSDFSGMTIIIHSDDKKYKTKAKLRAWIENLDEHSGKYILANNHGIKSTIPVFMADKAEIEECLSLKEREENATEIRLMNYAGTSFLASSEIAYDYDEKWKQWFESALNGDVRITLILTEPNSYAAKDAEKYKMYPPNGSKSEIKDIIPKNVKKVNDMLKKYKKIKLTAYLTDIALPYAIFETKFKNSDENHIKVDLYSPLTYNDDKRPSFMVYKKENPKLYKHFSDVIDHVIYSSKKIGGKNKMEGKKSEIFHLTKDKINSALSSEYRQYFIGELSRPQILNHLEQGDLEIGTSLYKEATADKPHLHIKTSEIIYVLKGIYKIFDIIGDKEYTLNEGDFFVLPPGTPYASKAMSGTQTFFIKTGGNDKVEISPDEKTKKWLEDLI